MGWPQPAAKHCCLLTQRDEGENWKSKSQNLMSQNKDSLMGETDACTSKAKWGIYALLLIGRKMFSYFIPEKYVNSYLERQKPQPRMSSLLPPFPELSLLSMVPLWYRSSFSPVWLSCLRFVSSRVSFAPPGYLLQEQSGRKKKTQCCANTAQQQPKHCCVINTVLVTSPKHSHIPLKCKDNE